MVTLLIPLYDTETGEFKGIDSTLAYIMFRADENEANGTILYCTSKNKTQNAFVGTAFKKHIGELIKELLDDSFSKLFFYLLSTTDWKEKKHQFLSKVSLGLNDYKYLEFQKMSPTSAEFLLQHLFCLEKNVQYYKRQYWTLSKSSCGVEFKCGQKCRLSFNGQKVKLLPGSVTKKMSAK